MLSSSNVTQLRPSRYQTVVGDKLDHEGHAMRWRMDSATSVLSTHHAWFVDPHHNHVTVTVQHYPFTGGDPLLNSVSLKYLSSSLVRSVLSERQEFERSVWRDVATAYTRYLTEHYDHYRYWDQVGMTAGPHAAANWPEEHTRAVADQILADAASTVAVIDWLDRGFELVDARELKVGDRFMFTPDAPEHRAVGLYTVTLPPTDIDERRTWETGFADDDGFVQSTRRHFQSDEVAGKNTLVLVPGQTPPETTGGDHGC